MTPLERAARAFHARSREMGGTGSQWDWDDPNYARVRADYTGLVRSMISALREPSTEMVVAGDREFRNSIRFDRSALAWRAMIDTLLEQA